LATLPRKISLILINVLTINIIPLKQPTRHEQNHTIVQAYSNVLTWLVLWRCMNQYHCAAHCQLCSKWTVYYWYWIH